MPSWPYELIRSNRRRRLAVQVTREATVRVLAPERLAATAIDVWLDSVEHWVTPRLTEMRRRLQTMPLPSFEPGSRLALLGREYELQFGATPRGEVRLIGGYLVVPACDSQEARKRLTRYYRQEAARILSEKTQTLAERHRIELEKISINRAKSRWGSCSARKRIQYSWRLILCPEEAVDYVVAHELAHCREMNHSARFYAVLDEFYPPWRKWQKYLKEEAWRYVGWE